MHVNEPQPFGGGISWFVLILGVALGVCMGLIYTWEIDPVVERNTAPWQLSAEGREDYVVAIALSYAQNQDLNQAFDQLRALRPDQNVWQMVADVACNRYKTGRTVTNADIRVIRALEQLYGPQGASGCADGQYPTPAPPVFETPIPTMTSTPTLQPPATKTPTPPLPTNVAPFSTDPTRTPSPDGDFILASQRSYCDADVQGLLEVYVQDRLGQGVPGVSVTVRWRGDQTDRFYTGLQPEQGADYADFNMETGRSYSVSIDGLTSTVPTIEAETCQTADGEESVRSYRIIFRQQ